MPACKPVQQQPCIHLQGSLYAVRSASEQYSQVQQPPHCREGTQSASAVSSAYRNALHALERIAAEQSYDKAALMQARQAAQRRGPITKRQQEMQGRAATKLKDNLKGLSKDYALLDAQKEVSWRVIQMATAAAGWHVASNSALKVRSLQHCHRST